MQPIATATGDRDAICDAIRQGHDTLEVRLDALWPTVPDEATATDDLATCLDVAQASGSRLLATLRPVRQGGAFDGPEEVRINLLLAAVQSGFHAVDLENDHPEVGRIATLFHDAGAQVILSDHRLPEAPSREEGLRRLTSMQDMRGDLQKLAVPCGSFMDALRCLELAHGHAHKHGAPVITPIGGGAPIRALLGAAGNHAHYGHARGNMPAVPGQPSLDDVETTRRHWGLPDTPGDPESGWLAVVGDPIDHSLSPRIHNAALAAAGRREQYGALQVPDSAGAMRLLCTVAPRIGLRGLSITAPLKHHAAGIAGDASVRAIGAANCMRFTATGSQATNTDATAITGLLSPHGPGHVAVLGAGGAARAAIHAARTLGCEVTFTSRDEARAKRVHDDLGGVWVPWDERHSIRADAWIQATPIGSRSDGPTPIEAATMEGATVALEMVYGDGPTRFEAAARQAGATIHDGRTMLMAQATHAYRYWFDEDPDTDAMQAALEGGDPA